MTTRKKIAEVLFWTLVIGMIAFGVSCVARQVAPPTERERYLVGIVNCYADFSGTTVRPVFDEHARSIAEGSWSNDREIHFARSWVAWADDETMMKAAIRGTCHITRYWRGGKWYRDGEVARPEELSLATCIVALDNYEECRPWTLKR